MNILLVNKTALDDVHLGMARSIETLAGGLSPQHKVLQFVPGPWFQHKLAVVDGVGGSEYRMAVPLPFGRDRRCSRFLSWAVRFPRTLLQARRLVRSKSIDIAHTTFHSDSILFWFLKRIEGLPYVVTLHGSDAVYFDRVPRPHRRFAERVIRGADAVIGVSDSVIQAAVCRFGPRLPLVRIRNGIDIEAIERSIAMDRVTPPILPKRYVATVGALKLVKGHDILLEAWARIAPKFTDVQLAIIGDGPERNRYEEMVRRLGIAGRVKFLGWVEGDRVLRILADAILHVMPSRSEGLPYVLLEAGVCETATLATRVGGIPEVIEDGVSGRLVPPEDPGSLAQALESLLANDRQRCQLAHELRQRVVGHFSARRMVLKHESLYECVMQRRRVPTQT